MNFRLRTETLGESVDYAILDGENRAGEISWHIGDTGCFVMDVFRMESGFRTFENTAAVLEFVRYKAVTAGCRELQIRVASANRQMVDWLQDFGYYTIAEELIKGKYGEENCILTLKEDLVNVRDSDTWDIRRRKKALEKGKIDA